jgi:hypothetical protein
MGFWEGNTKEEYGIYLQDEMSGFVDSMIEARAKILHYLEETAHSEELLEEISLVQVEILEFLKDDSENIAEYFVHDTSLSNALLQVIQ